MTESAPADRTPWWRSSWAALALVLVVHVVFVTRRLPLDVAFGAAPILNIDYSLHWFRASVHASEFGGPLASWGYDPFHMAGWVAGTFSGLDDEALVGWTWLFGRVFGIGRAFNLFFLVAYTLVPLTAYAAARLVDRPRAEAVVATAALAIAWNLDVEVVSWVLFGTYAFLLACVVAVPVTALVARAIRDPGRRGVLLLAASAPLFYLHAHTALMTAILGFTLFGPMFRSGPRRALMVVGAVAAIVVVNLPWILPTAADLHLYDPLPRVDEAARAVRHSELPELLHSLSLPEPRLFGLLLPLVLAPFGLARLARSGRRDMAIAWGVGALVVFLTAYFGNQSDLVRKFIEANRMRPAIALVTAVPTGLGAVAVFERWRAWKAGLRWGAVVVVALLLPALGAHRTVATRLLGRKALTAGLTPQAAELFDALRALGDPAGRVALEETGPRPQLGVWSAAIAPRETGRAFLGGPYYRGWVPHSDASFTAGRFGVRPVAELSDDEIAAFLDLYDVTALAAETEPAVVRLRAAAGVVEEAGTVGPYVLFRTRRAADPFLVGAGEVDAQYDRIDVRPAGPGDVALKMHWDRRLVVDPPRTLVREEHPADRVGFIRVNGGGGTPFTIRLRGR